MNHKILLAPTATEGGKGQSTAELMAENAELRAQVADLKGQVSRLEAQQQKNAEREKAIIAKMVHGLSREQAIAVLDRQEAYDKGKAEAAKAPKAETKTANSR